MIYYVGICLEFKSFMQTESLIPQVITEDRTRLFGNRWYTVLIKGLACSKHRCRAGSGSSRCCTSVSHKGRILLRPLRAEKRSTALSQG
jgi:hypothetical protein